MVGLDLFNVQNQVRGKDTGYLGGTTSKFKNGIWDY